MAVELIENGTQLPAFSRFHFPGYRISINDIAEALRNIDERKVQIKPFPWWALQLAAPFVPLLKSLLEMRYLWQQPLDLDGGKLEQVLGMPVAITPLPQALRESGQLSRAGAR